MKHDDTRRTVIFVVTLPQSVKHFGRLPSRLNDRGWDVHIVSGSVFSQHDRNAPITHHHVPMVREPSPLNDLRSLLALFQLFIRLRPSIIACATPKASLLSVLAGYLARRPNRIYLLWGLRLETTSGFRRKALRVAEKLTLRLSTRTIAVSSSLRDACIDQGLAEPQDVEVLGQGSSRGVDMQIFRPASFSEKQGLEEEALNLGLLPGIPVIGYCGRLSEDKGIRLLADSLELLNEQKVEHQLLFAGADETQGELTQLLRKSTRNVVHLGVLDDTSRFYRMLDVFCLPTRREGMPNVSLEASASGVAVVTTNVTGARDSVLHGKTGLILKSNTKASLAAALSTLCRNPSLRESFGESGRAWVARYFDEPTVIEKQLALFEHLPFPAKASGVYRAK